MLDPNGAGDREPTRGGGFLVWWYQNMPAFGAGKTLPDGAPMLSLWPFMFY